MMRSPWGGTLIEDCVCNKCALSGVPSLVFLKILNFNVSSLTATQQRKPVQPEWIDLRQARRQGERPLANLAAKAGAFEVYNV